MRDSPPEIQIHLYMILDLNFQCRLLVATPWSRLALTALERSRRVVVSSGDLLLNAHRGQPGLSKSQLGTLVLAAVLGLQVTLLTQARRYSLLVLR